MVHGESLEEELELLSADVARLGGLAERAVSESLRALIPKNEELARSVIERDALVNEGQLQVDSRVAHMLATFNPSPSDVRWIIAALKVSIDLERVGDLAKNIARRTLRLSNLEPSLLGRVERMGSMVASLLNEALDAYSSRRADHAVSAWFQDDVIDEQYKSLFREVLTHMMEDPRLIGASAELLFIAKHIERIGDHATNIAELVHYAATGQELDPKRRGLASENGEPQ